MNTLRTTLMAALLLQTGHAIAGDAIDETRNVDANAVIDIEVTNGTVTLTGWDENRFRITGELSDAAEGYELREVNGGIRFKENIDRPGRRGCSSWGWNNRCDYDQYRATLDIHAPRNSVLRFEGINVEVSTEGLYGNTEIELVNGEITATNLRGSMKLQTVNGDIEATRLNGRISLETVNGSIDDTGSDGSRISLSTVNGSIDSNTRSQRISVETVNGDIELDAGTIDELEMSTVGGRLEAVVTMNEQANVDISSVGGRIELALPKATSARFNVTTSVGGRITNELSDDRPVRENRYVNSSELDFTLGSGSGDVDISTVSGNVTLRGQ